jgi:hypothetical protein
VGLHRHFALRLATEAIALQCGDLHAAFVHRRRDTTVQMQVSAVWPDDAMFVSPIMTTIENLEKFFIVPGMELSVIPGMLYPVQFQISITDEVLEATATELTDNFGYMTQYTDGTGPFKPFNLAQLGRRIAYFVENKVYISDQDDYERVTEDQHVLQLPGERYVVTACQIRGVNYFFGPKWTYAAVDNEDVPVLWAAPYAVSLGQGTSAVHGVVRQHDRRHGLGSERIRALGFRRRV